jgi:hypothetical protein
LAIADILYKDDLEMLEAAQIDLYEELSWEREPNTA